MTLDVMMSVSTCLPRVTRVRNVRANAKCVERTNLLDRGKGGLRIYERLIVLQSKTDTSNACITIGDICMKF